MNNGQNIVDNNTQITDEFGNAIQTQYVDEFGNPIDPSLIDENGNYIGETQYVDEQGNPIDPSLIDESGNYIGPIANNQNPITETNIEQSAVANALNTAQGEVPPVISTSQHQMDDKELMEGMVTFDYNNVPITDIVNSIILDAINKGASDIHFDPFDDGIKIRIRIDGQLNDYSIVPLFVKKNMITRVKIISGMNITESRTPQDGAIRTELANKTIDLRVSCLPTNMGEKIVIRIMDYSMSASGVEALDFNEKNLEKVNKMLSLPNGIILVTGATGSGKSTTVYSMLQKLNVEGTNLVTVEDPIEMNIGGINQVQAVSEIGLTFASVLRSILRQDPDVIMIGEIRDDETARIAVRASITGHLVLSTIHTNNSLNTIERLTDMSVERYLLGTALAGIVSQKLARRLCPKCRHLRPTNDYEKEIFQKVLKKTIDNIYEPVGCPSCSRGYRGRIAIQEVLLLNQTIQDAITKGVPKNILRNLVYSENGTETMLQDGLEKVVDGKTSFEEIIKLIDLEDDLGSGTQLGLENQITDSSSGMSTPQNLNGPININITPELLSGLTGLKNLANLAYDSDEDDEEVIIKPVKKKKKKKRIIEIDPDELKNTEDNDSDEEIEVIADESVVPELKANHADDSKNEQLKTLDEIKILDDHEILAEPKEEIEILDIQEEAINTCESELLNAFNTIGKKKFIINTTKLINKLATSPINDNLKVLIDNFIERIKNSKKLTIADKQNLLQQFNDKLNYKNDLSLFDVETDATIETLESIENNSPITELSESELDEILGTTNIKDKPKKKSIKVAITDEDNNLTLSTDTKKIKKKDVKVSIDDIDTSTTLVTLEKKQNKKDIPVDINEENDLNIIIQDDVKDKKDSINVNLDEENDLKIKVDEKNNEYSIETDYFTIDNNEDEIGSAIDEVLLDTFLNNINQEDEIE